MRRFIWGEDRRDLIINFLSNTYTIKEIYEFLNDGLTEHTQVLLEILADTIQKNGYKNLKFEVYDHCNVWDFEEKSLQETYRFLKRFCLKMTPEQIEELMWLI